MTERQDISSNKVASGLLRGAAVAGLVSGLAAASLGGGPTANATCIGFSGINIGTPGQCTTELGTIAAVLGDGTATARGFFTGAISVGGGSALAEGIATAAWAGGEGSLAESAGILDWAVAQGTNVAAFAGVRTFDFLNFAFNFGSALDTFDSGGPAYSWVQASDGAFNLAGNLGGSAGLANPDPTPMIVWSGGDDETLGFGTVAASVFGNRNDVRAIGSLLNATAWGNLLTNPNGSDNIVYAGDIGDPQFLAWAFSYQGIFSEPPEACTTGLCGNTVNATGPAAIAGAIGVVQRIVDQEGFGISLATRFNDTGLPANVLAASGTQGNRVGLNSTGNDTNVLATGGTPKNRDRLNSTGSNTNGVAASSTQENRVRPSLNAASNRSETTSTGGSERKSVSEHITRANKSSDSDSSGTGGRTRDVAADADGTSGSDSSGTGGRTRDAAADADGTSGSDK